LAAAVLTIPASAMLAARIDNLIFIMNLITPSRGKNKQELMMQQEPRQLCGDLPRGVMIKAF
jgi:hypothetical protein